ncbi:anoctamin-10-like isoform X2 [Biomphalaria glabrata]|uniref:Anoctamin n=1 Tax=Biomphalaria glabrata TaxID=6526 RepID=A0A9W3AWD8_BIOGL|nr:anoctamin-10-like isoform X2 [Biomphalaria glabrata]
MSALESSVSAPSVSSRVSIEDFSNYTMRMQFKKKNITDDIFQQFEFEPQVIMEFEGDVNQAALEWLIAKLQAPRIDLGAELLVFSDYREHNKETVLYIGATLDRLLIGAEEMKIPKIYKDGSLRELCLSDITQFEKSDNLLDFLTSAEKQKVIIKGIENIRATEDDHYIPGYPKYTLYPGKSIIKKYLSRHIITNLFPLHEQEKLKLIARKWYTLKNYFKPQPIDSIQEYFGVKIALYFSFLGMYTISLIPPALIGIIYFFFPWQSVYKEATFALFNVIWSTVFLEGWKRYCNSLCFKWGTIESSMSYYSFEEPRADYYGVISRNPVTGQLEPEYPKWKRVLKFYLVSIPIITFCLTIAFLLMLAYFWGEFWMKKNAPQNLGIISKMYSLIPAVMYAITIGILNSIYRQIAVKLNKFENHRLPSSYENHLILKHVLFDFVNCFICLFYVAFYLQDRELLKTFLGTILITQQILGQLNEAMVPFLFMRRRQKQVDDALKKSEDTLQENSIKGNLTGSQSVSTSYKKQAALEGMMDRFNGSNDDYLELYIQFGYVYLFSSAFPLAALWALINNFIEIRTDAFKLCRVFQRPFAESANNIGAWQQAFEVVGIISVITNCALIGMDPEVQKLLPSTLTPVNMVLIFVATEHIVLAIKASIALLIPDIPKSVSLQLAKQEYAAKMALKRQRLRDAAAKKRALIEAWKRRPVSGSDDTM